MPKAPSKVQERRKERAWNPYGAEPSTRVRIPHTPYNAVDTPYFTGRKEAVRKAHRKTHDAWVAEQQHLTSPEQNEIKGILNEEEEECNYDEIDELSQILGEMRTSDDDSQMKIGGGGKMVGGNPVRHFLALQRWVTTKIGESGSIMSECAKWFINKILDGFKTISGATFSVGTSTWYALIDITKYAMGDTDTRTFQYLVAICSNVYTATTDASGIVLGDIVDLYNAAAGAATTAATATAAAIEPFKNVFTAHIVDLLTNHRDKFIGKIPNLTEDNFKEWLNTLSMRDVMTAVANIIAAGKWGAVGFTAVKLTSNLVLTTGYYGIVAAAWISNSYVLTGTWLTYQVFSNLGDDKKQLITDAFNYLDNCIAGKIEVKDIVKAKLQILTEEPMANALVLASLDKRLVEAQLKHAERVAALAHQTNVKNKLTEIGLITEASDMIAEEGLQMSMVNAIKEARITAGNSSYVSGAAAGSGTNSQPPIRNTAEEEAGAGAAASNMDWGKGGGKRATRKRGKRNSKRAPRKSKSSRKKRRGKK